MDNRIRKISIEANTETGEVKTEFMGSMCDLAKLFSELAGNLIIAMKTNQIPQLDTLEKDTSLGAILDFHKGKLITILAQIDIDELIGKIKNDEVYEDYKEGSIIPEITFDGTKPADLFEKLADEIFRKEDENDR